ncbi:DUF5683 domain-containing protein [Flavisolibacter tropicus]|uniref:DUF5683 domain-containing protein n=1 Tax=Flavisolibacter tropicus TaxID=1492898 RepID=UPI00082B6045|nr:DUF5683 domain-containing protein [Flavisolibacter tropicus]
MTKKILHSFFLIGLLLIVFNNRARGQVIRDSAGRRIEVGTTPDQKIDSVLNTHSPRKAAIRSAIIPGWGQAYNKKYWKIPIVYAALGTSAYVFYYNLTWYKRCRYAYTVAVTDDVAHYDDVYIKLQPFVKNPNGEGTLKIYRNDYRRYIDYSVVAFVLLWGLNVVDATVDAHLKSFDVSPDLSFQIKPGYSELGNTHGISLVLAFK